MSKKERMSPFLVGAGYSGRTLEVNIFSELVFSI